MNAARDVSPCQRFDRWITAYVDDELDAIHALEVEDHLDECGLCSERVTQLKATRCSLKRQLSCKCPSALRARISQVLVDAGGCTGQAASRTGQTTTAPLVEDEQAPASTQLPGAMVAASGGTPLWWGSVTMFRLRNIMPLAAAATVLLVFGVMRLQQQELTTALPPRAHQGGAAATLDHLLEEMITQHAHPLPPETTDPNGLAKFDPYLGLHVRSPKFDIKNVRYLGARMMPRHATLHYKVRDRHRVSLYVFDAKRVPLRANRLRPKHIGARNVYVGNMRGYSVAASERNGIGYVLASDLPDDETAEMVLMAAR